MHAVTRPMTRKAVTVGVLEGKSIVITGASSGIGAAIARRFVAEGALLTLGSRRDPGLDDATFVATDVADPADADALIAAAVDTHGMLDAVVNNAGVLAAVTVADTTDDDFDRMLGVNTRGVFNCCRAAVRHMRNHGGGVIVNIGSVGALQPDVGMAVYNASKGAVHALSRSIAVDHGVDGIRCNTIAPGWIATEMAQELFDAAPDPAAVEAAAAAAHPVGRLGIPEDIAAMALWLVSDDASFVSGSVFTVDGGLTAQSPIRP